MKSAEEIKQTLAGFYGTSFYYGVQALVHTGVIKFNLTDGVKYLVETAECYWLLDIIASVWHLRKNEGVHSYTLKVDLEKATAVFTTNGRSITAYRSAGDTMKTCAATSLSWR